MGERNKKYQEDKLIQKRFIKVILDNDKKSCIKFFEYQHHPTYFLELLMVPDPFKKLIDCRSIPLEIAERLEFLQPELIRP